MRYILSGERHRKFLFDCQDGHYILESHSAAGAAFLTQAVELMNEKAKEEEAQCRYMSEQG